ncbi:type I glutamate--ammonia ligase [Lachnospiraceae bacterium 62-35]
MSRYTREDIFRMVEEEDVEFIRLQFTDIFGIFKNVAITVSQLERALDNQCMFDGSGIEGFMRIEQSDMYLYPDLDTFEIFPWRPQQGKVARFICDVCRPDGEHFPGDPRFVLKRVLEEGEKMGYSLTIKPECEFFLFHMDEEGRPTTNTHENGGYFDVGPIDLAENVRRDIVLSLEEMGFEIEASYHEISPAQHEIDFGESEGLKGADNIMTSRMAIRNIAKRHGLYATFMPKPKEGVNGSGLHINMTLQDGKGKNVFYDESDKLGMSRKAYQFIAGILFHAREMMLLTSPLINSYKRLIPGYDAPNYITWSEGPNSSALIRIPSFQNGKAGIELRGPDSAVNPYLVVALCLAAGLDGIRKEMVPPDSVNENIYAMTGREREEKGICCLPETMGEAIEAFRSSGFVKHILGEHIYTKYLAAKEKEWEEFRSHVTDWEIREYLRKF